MTTSDRKLADISLILKDLLKVIKVVSMYPEDNPLPQSLRRSFAEKLESIVDDHGEIMLGVHEHTMVYYGDSVYRNRSREENLAGIFYDAGITEITFKPGLEVLEIYKLLDVIKTYLNAPDKSQDLAALIWEAGVSGFSLKTLEDVALSEYDNNFNIREYIDDDGRSSAGQGGGGSNVSDGYNSIFTREEDSGKWESSQLDISGDSPSGDSSQELQIGEAIPIGLEEFYRPIDDTDSNGIQYNEIQDSSSAQATMDMPSMPGEVAPSSKSELIPDSSLILNDEFKLSEEEEEIIRELIEEDAEFEPYSSTLELLKEMLLQELELPGFTETITICERVLNEFIRLARLTEASSLLEHLKKLEARIRSDKPMWADRLKEAYITAGSRGRLEGLSESLNASPDVNPTELKKYLNNFGWEALGGITELVGQLEHQRHRDAVLEFLSDRGKDNLDMIARGVFDKNLDVVRNAMSILARVADDKALSYLSKLVSHDDAEIRMQLVLLLRDCGNENALPTLKRMVSDSNPQIRRAAVNSIVSRRGRPAFEVITDVINDEKFPSLEEDDQQALLSAFSVLGGDKAVTFLSELILTNNYFRDRTLAFLRSAAFEALIVNRSEKVEQLLIRLTKSWRPDIKRQALSAIQRRRETLFGDA